MPWSVPPLLRPGSTVRVIAPASPLPSRTPFLAGLAWLRQRYQLRMTAEVFAREGYLAGSDTLRLAQLQRALDEPDCEAIVMARGGYGITRLLERLDLTALRRAPKWLVGFSDGTALHAGASALEICSLHASNVNGLAALSSADRHAWIVALEQGAATRWDGLRGDRPCRARGPAFGGNLSLLQALAAAGALRPPPGAVWFVEDVTERPYRLDRMAVSLRPALRTASAVVIGELFGCTPGADGISAEAALASAWSDLGVPLVFGAPFGHGAQNAPLVFGADATVDVNAAREARVELAQLV